MRGAQYQISGPIDGRSFTELLAALDRIDAAFAAAVRRSVPGEGSGAEYDRWCRTEEGQQERESLALYMWGEERGF